MELDYWLARWNKGRTGFHAAEVNEHLVRWWKQIGIPSDGVVFVPLCGKSLDMAWLADQDCNVIGVEASEKACRMFFEEASLPYETIPHNTFTVFKGSRIEIWCGDFFELSANDLPLPGAVYDRAALVAMPPHKRSRYVEKIKQLTHNNLIMLLVSFTYPQENMSGPPFSVQENEIKQLFGAGYAVRKLSSIDVLEKSQKFKKRGLSELQEISYLVKSQ